LDPVTKTGPFRQIEFIDNDSNETHIGGGSVTHVTVTTLGSEVKRLQDPRESPVALIQAVINNKVSVKEYLRRFKISFELIVMNNFIVSIDLT